MRLKIVSYSAMVLLLLMVGCKKENMCDCVKTTGTIVMKTRDVSGFTCIHLEDKIDLYLTKGPVFEVKVEAGEHLQSLIRTELDGETLKVVNNNRCNWVRGYKHTINVYVTAPYFNYLDHWGVGNMYTSSTLVQDTVKCKTHSSGDIHLDVNASAVICSTHGNGDIYLSGITNRLENDYTGTNYLYAKDLTVGSYIYLHSASLGNAYIHAPQNGLMDIRMEESGNIYYTGDPAQVNLVRTGKGDLIKQ